MKLKFVTLIAAMALALAACDDDHPNPDDQLAVDHEVKTPLQKQYSSMDDCKKEFSTEGDCTTTTVIVDNQPQTVFISPLFYPWGAIYHPWGWGYGYAVPAMGSGRIVATTLPTRVSAPNYSNASSYSSARVSSMSAARGGFGGTAARASSSSSSSSGSSGG